MKILFVTGVYPLYNEDLVQKYCKNSRPSSAANVFQWAVIDGLSQNHADFEVLSYPFLPCFPMNYSRLFTPKCDLEYKDENIGELRSYCTLPIIKYVSIEKRLRRDINKWVEKYYKLDDNLVVLTYTPCSFFLKAVGPLKKKYQQLKVCTIVTDLPDFFTSPLNNLKGFKKIQASYEQKAALDSYKYIDKYILLTRQMERRIPEAINRNIIVEGISTMKSMPQIKKKDSVKKTILYTGALRDGMGIRDLVDAFMLTVNPNFELEICGAGECASYVTEKAKIDTRIKYLGRVSREKSIECQNKATVLINPRKPQEFTEYSFPSKTMEYLSSGTPMIGYKLQGIPHEYFDYFYTIDSMDSHALADLINRILCLSQEELDKKAKEAASFILSNKTPKIQVKKIIDFLND